MKILWLLIITLSITVFSTCAFAAGETTAPAAQAPDVKITISAKDTPVTDVIASIMSQSKAKILTESTVQNKKATLSLSDTSVESALSAVCKPTNLVWRKVYLDPKSELIDKPDRLAATLRLLAGLSFPDMIVAGSSTNKTSIYSQQKSAVDAAQEKMVKELGLTSVYIISNDAVIAAKEAAKNTPIAKYNDMAKQQVEMFLKMSPEEREQALAAGLDLMESVGPEYYASMMQTMMNADPQRLARLASRQTEMLFSMSADQRRAMMKMNIEMMQKITPEQKQILADDAKAIMQEMQNQSSGN